MTQGAGEEDKEKQWSCFPAMWLMLRPHSDQFRRWSVKRRAVPSSGLWRSNTVLCFHRLHHSQTKVDHSCDRAGRTGTGNRHVPSGICVVISLNLLWMVWAATLLSARLIMTGSSVGLQFSQKLIFRHFPTQGGRVFFSNSYVPHRHSLRETSHTQKIKVRTGILPQLLF